MQVKANIFTTVLTLSKIIYLLREIIEWNIQNNTYCA